MSSKLNSEFNYRTQVIGETPWEKIKTLKGFLEGRLRAADLEQVSELKYQAKLAELEHLKKIQGLKHVMLNLQAEILEIESHRRIHADVYELNRQEIAILEKLLDDLYVIVEPTRIDGYTDEQMFEVNASNEFTATIGKDILSEMIAYGRPSAAKIRNAMSNPETWYALKAAGLIPEKAQLLVGGNDPLKLEYIVK